MEKQSFFDILWEYILDGFKVAVIVGAMLIGYIAIIALLIGVVSAIFTAASGGSISWDFHTFFGFIFASFAFLIGVSWIDDVHAGSMWSIIILSYELVAILS